MVYRTGNSSDPTGWRAYHMKDFLIFACIGNTRNFILFPGVCVHCNDGLPNWK